jgi:hypothetical protein
MCWTPSETVLMGVGTRPIVEVDDTFTVLRALPLPAPAFETGECVRLVLQYGVLLVATAGRDGSAVVRVFDYQTLSLLGMFRIGSWVHANSLAVTRDRLICVAYSNIGVALLNVDGSQTRMLPMSRSVIQRVVAMDNGCVVASFVREPYGVVGTSFCVPDNAKFESEPFTVRMTDLCHAFGSSVLFACGRHVYVCERNLVLGGMEMRVFV